MLQKQQILEEKHLITKPKVYEKQNKTKQK